MSNEYLLSSRGLICKYLGHGMSASVPFRCSVSCEGGREAC